MRYIAAYLLLNLAGNENPTAADVAKVLASAGVEADEERINTLVSELEGKSAEELIAEGKGKLASVPAGGAAAAGGAGAGAAAAGEEAAAAEEKEEEEEESDDDMGFGLFD